MFDLLRKTLVPMLTLNIYYWLFISVIVFSVAYLIYRQFTKVFLQRIGVRNKFILPLTETTWQLCYLIITGVMIFVHCLEGNVLNSWVNRLDNELAKCKVHEEINVPGIKTVFILHTAFAIHEILDIWLNRGFKNLDFLQKQVFLAIFLLSDYSKCTMFGISVWFLTSLSKMAELSSKLLFIYADTTNSNRLRNMSKTLCGVSMILWMYTFLYVYPVFLNFNKSINSNMMKMEVNMLIILDFFSWVYLAVAIINSMFTRVMLSYNLVSPERPQSLEYFLLGCEPWVLWLTSSQRSKSD